MLQEVRRLLKPQGYAVHPLKTRAFYLTGYNLKPDVVFDVGVHDGTPWLYRSFPKAQFVLVDPQPGCEETVRKKGWIETFDFHPVALGPQDGTARLRVPQTEKGNGGAMASLRDRRDRLAKTFTSVDEIEVPVRRLDDIAAGYDGRLGLKIDTEGYEAEVLEGATETLKRTDFVILELSVTRRFDGVAVPSASMRLLADAGLEMRDVLAIADGAGPRAQPRHMDVMFTRWSA